MRISKSKLLQRVKVSLYNQNNFYVTPAYHSSYLTLGAHARGLLLCVCLSVTALATSACVYGCYHRHTPVSRRLSLDFDSWIFETP